MQELEFAELDENGRLVVVAEDGTQYAVPVDDRLRAALRPRPQRDPGDGSAPATATPREVQAMIRAGQTAEDVASGTGWDLARVRRFEGPVLAEREHVVGLAKAAHVRAQGRTDGSHTLERRVRERLQSRGVPPADTHWDAARTGSQGPWTVVVSFSAGGRERRATWHYEVQDRSIEALDDEARWLSEDEQALPGGLAGHPLLGTSTAEDETADLMATMRERRQARSRRGRRPEPRAEDRDKPAGGGIDNEPLPLEDLAYDPETMGDPPAAHPRGSAPEAPNPVQPAEQEVDDAAASRPESARARKERRRLRLPKLPPVLGEPTEEETGADDAEISYARTHDPQEVSFDEFFGTDEEVDVEGASGPGVSGELIPEVPDESFEPDGEATGVADDEAAAVADDPAPVAAEDTAPDEDDLDVGQDELVDEEEQIAAGGQAEAPDDSPAAGRRKGRTSVPSWDDIMFGGGDRRRG